jgi:hypothetical protein
MRVGGDGDSKRHHRRRDRHVDGVGSRNDAVLVTLSRCASRSESFLRRLIVWFSASSLTRSLFTRSKLSWITQPESVPAFEAYTA